jgi:hypothetical protein
LERRLKDAEIMPVSKGRKRKPPKRDTGKEPASQAPKKEGISLRRLIEIVLALATLIGVPAAVVAFWPRMTVTASALFDESNAYSETFTVANIGFLPFEDVQMGVGICQIETEKHDFAVSPNNCENDIPHIMVGGASWWTPELRRDEPFSIVLSDGLNVVTTKYRKAHPTVVASIQMMSELKAANVIVSVQFKPWPLPHKMFKYFRFVADEQPNEKMMWRAVPLSWRKMDLP